MEHKGIAAAAGIAIGTALVLYGAKPISHSETIAHDQVSQELERFRRAAAAASLELTQIVEVTRKKLGDSAAEIFETHLLLFQDEEFIGTIHGKIEQEQKSSTWALTETTNEITAIFESLDDEYLRARAADIRDVSRRIMNHLTGNVGFSWESLTGSFILLAEDLTPSDTAMLDRDKVAGFATKIGGYTSHSSIIARTLGIPAVVGLGADLEHVQNGQFVIVDGSNGKIFVDPDQSTIEHYEQLKLEHEKHEKTQEMYRTRSTVTRDGYPLKLESNIGVPRDAQKAKAAGAEGVGLFRTEFLYMDRDSLPTEEEQFDAYRQAVEAFPSGEAVVIRTLDIGGDKFLPYLPLPVEANPFLGQRAIRLCFEHKDIFHTQLRAILRASAYGNIRIMFPMIATLSEWRKAKAMLEMAKVELRAEGIPFQEKLKTGIMIEIPAAALLADRFAKEVDFFSIGTNDLVQYTMAADRMNEKLAYLTDPFYPAVLRLIAGVIKAAEQEGKDVSMCGEMAGQLNAIPLLLGMGLKEFSMSSNAIVPARALLARINQQEAVKLAGEALEMESPEEIKALITQRLEIWQG